MKFELVSKNTEEVIYTVDLADIWLNGAKTYFMKDKQLDKEEFDKLFIVRVKEETKPVLSNSKVKWWEEESTKLDEF